MSKISNNFRFFSVSLIVVCLLCVIGWQFVYINSLDKTNSSLLSKIQGLQEYSLSIGEIHNNSVITINKLKEYNLNLIEENRELKTIETKIGEMEDLFKKEYFNQGILYSHLYRMIEKSLKPDGKFTKDVAFLLMYTAVIESDCGRIFYEVGGKAEGIFQIMPGTEQWILSLNPKLQKSELDTDLKYQIILAYELYKTRANKFPRRYNISSVYDTYKRYWNTYQGATTRAKADKKTKEFLKWWNTKFENS